MSNEAAVSASVYYRDSNGVLEPYDQETCKSILAAAAEGRSVVQIRSGLGVSEFDLKNMKQRTLLHILGWGLFDEKDIVIEIPWNAKRLKAAETLKEDNSLRRKILEMAVDRIRARQSLEKILDLKALPAKRLILQNPYLERGLIPYDEFVDSLLEATLTTKGEKLYDAVLAIVSDGFTKANLRVLEELGLRLVFHGTNEACMDNIMKTGLLPEFRMSGSGDLDWFGVDYRTSLDYTMQKTMMASYGQPRHVIMPLITQQTIRVGTIGQILLFMVLQPQCEIRQEPYSGYVTSTCNSFQLPLATVTVDYR